MNTGGVDLEKALLEFLTANFDLENGVFESLNETYVGAKRYGFLHHMVHNVEVAILDRSKPNQLRYKNEMIQATLLEQLYWGACNYFELHAPGFIAKVYVRVKRHMGSEILNDTTHDVYLHDVQILGSTDKVLAYLTFAKLAN